MIPHFRFSLPHFPQTSFYRLSFHFAKFSCCFIVDHAHFMTQFHGSGMPIIARLNSHVTRAVLAHRNYFSIKSKFDQFASTKEEAKAVVGGFALWLWPLAEWISDNVGQINGRKPSSRKAFLNVR
jgi:hypothetical protein